MSKQTQLDLSSLPPSLTNPLLSQILREVCDGSQQGWLVCTNCRVVVSDDRYAFQGLCTAAMSPHVTYPPPPSLQVDLGAF